MDEVITESHYSREVNMRVVESDKYRQYVSITDLVVAVMDNMKKEQRAEFLLRMFSWDESIDAFKSMLNGECGTDENDNKTDVLRKVCLEHSSEAVKVLLANALEAVHKEKQRVDDLKEHIENMEKQWPEPYKKYMPKRDFFFPKYIDATDQAQKMLDEAKREEGGK